MLQKLEIRCNRVEKTPALEELIQEQADRLGKFYPRPFELEVGLNGPGNHHQKGGSYKAILKISVPGKIFAISHQEGLSPEAATREGFAAAQRVLEDHARILRGEVKTNRAPQASADVS